MKNNPIFKNPALLQQMGKETDSRPAPPQNLTIKKVEPEPYVEGRGKEVDVNGYLLGIFILVVIAFFFIWKKYV